MASWRDKLQPASFRGAGFYVETHDAEVGRRTARHEYPKRDLPYSEDLGRKPRVYRVNAVVIGPDYMAARDALLAACEQEGPATLVHPYLGSLEVVCEGCSFREELRAGGQATFSLTFCEAGKREYPAQTIDWTAQASDAAGSARAVAGDVFAQVYRTTGPAWLGAAAAGDLKTALTLVRMVAAALPSVLDNQAVGQFLGQLDGLLGQTGTITNQGGATVAGTLGGAVTGLGTVGGANALGGLLDLSKFGAPNDPTTSTYGVRLATVPTTTANRQTQASNQTALTALVRRLAISTGVESALGANYTSREQGAATRDRVLDGLDARLIEAGNSGDDATYQALRQLYATSDKAFVAKLGGLRSTRSVTVPPAGKSALALAYDLYGDLDRADQIVIMNNVPHPGVLPGGEAIGVLDG